MLRDILYAGKDLPGHSSRYFLTGYTFSKIYQHGILQRIDCINTLYFLSILYNRMFFSAFGRGANPTNTFICIVQQRFFSDSIADGTFLGVITLALVANDIWQIIWIRRRLHRIISDYFFPNSQG